MNKKIYFLSGLGADRRAFQNLSIPEYEAIHIIWDTALPKESIESYATKLLKQIVDKNPILIGLSFGGMMAIEIAKQIKTKQVIIISSISTCHELPFYFKFFGLIQLHRLLPDYLLKQTNQITNWLFGAHDKFAKKIMQDIFAENDPVFLRWCMGKIVQWENRTIPDKIIHIHGTEDHIFPARFVKSDYWVKNGGHLMVLNKSAEISALIMQTIRSVE